MDYRNADWIPWYVDDSPGWLELSLAARGAMAEIARKLNRKTGTIELRRGLSSLAGLLRVRWEGELEPALTELIEKGKLTWNGDAGLLCDPDYLDRRRPTSTERVNEYRRRKAETDETLQPFQQHESLHVTDVTVKRHRGEESRSDQIDRERAGACTPELTAHRVARLQAIAQAAGITIDPRDEWETYVADRARKAKPISDADWEYWLRNAVKFARRDREKARTSSAPPGASERSRKSLEGFKA